ncbi:MAG TPA: thioredoxin-disulfide reductase [Planctomycetes bacterium]|nr:thioredoxin-disulfide reductase [Planctomycetota bacterium]
MDTVKTKVAIIGSGPSGWTAAIYTARANLRPVLFEGLQPGGQLTITTEVENYPGFPDGVQGPELMQAFKAQALRFDTVVFSEQITEADFSSRPFRLKSDSREVLADAVIISTGASARYLGLPGEEAFYNKGISACATCDGFFFRGKEVAVLGGGDSAVEEAVFLTRFCTKVHLIHRRDELRASKIMQQRAIDNEKIEIHWNRVVEGYEGDDQGRLIGVRLKDTKSGEIEDLAVEGLFMAIGHVPNTQIFKGQLDMDEAGYLITKPDSTYTNVDGVFACGDVQDRTYRQAVTAAGSGCMAAIDSERWLEAQGD